MCRTIQVLALALLLSLHPETSGLSALQFFCMPCGDWDHCCSLAPSCGAVQGDLLHFAQLCQQPFHAVFELRQTGQRLRRLQLPSVVQPALQHWGGQAEEEPEVSTSSQVMGSFTLHRLYRGLMHGQPVPGMMQASSLLATCFITYGPQLHSQMSQTNSLMFIGLTWSKFSELM